MPWAIGTVGLVRLWHCKGSDRLNADNCFQQPTEQEEQSHGIQSESEVCSQQEKIAVTYGKQIAGSDSQPPSMRVCIIGVLGRKPKKAVLQ